MNENMAERLIKARKDKHMSQRGLADQVGTSLVSIKCWESGVYEPTAYSVRRLCKALEISADWLLGLKDYDVIIQEKDA